MPSLEKDFGLNAPLLLWLCLQPTMAYHCVNYPLPRDNWQCILPSSKDEKENNEDTTTNIIKIIHSKHVHFNEMQAIKRHGLIIIFKFVHIPHNKTTLSLLCYLLEVLSIITNKVGYYQKKKVGCGCALNLNTKATNFRMSSKQVFLCYPLGSTRK
jgi:hypothetical protein